MTKSTSGALWVVAGAAVTALGTVAGTRILTQLLSPQAFGVVSLALGLSALAMSIVSTPLTQAAIHYYPLLAGEGAAQELLASLRRCFRKAIPWIAAAAAVGACAYIRWMPGQPITVLILGPLLAADCWRSANLSLLNAGRRHRIYALWVASDAWLRPLTAAGAMLFLGSSPATVLVAYLVVSTTLICVFPSRAWPAQGLSSADTATSAAALDRRMWSYALPLLPLGLMGWVSNLGDRYVIGAVLSVADAGVYAAVYGLASAPFMMAGGTAELVLRPIHQTAAAHGDRARARRIFKLWLAVVVGVCAVGVLVFAAGHRLIAALLLGPAYRQASGLMPWIGLGYAIRSASYVFERMCYAYGQTRRVLTIQICGVLATIVGTPFGVLNWGLRGAAIAVPMYFSVQLAAAIILARRTDREQTRPRVDSLVAA